LAGYFFGPALGLTPEETLRILREWNRRNKPPLADRELKGVVDSIASKESRKKNRTCSLADINAFLGVNILRIEQFSGHESNYRLTLQVDENEVVEIFLTASQLISKRSLQVKVAEGARIMIHTPKGRGAEQEWEALCQGLLSNTEVINSGPEATQGGLVVEIYYDFMEAKGAWTESEKPQQNYGLGNSIVGALLTREGWFFRLSDFSEYCQIVKKYLTKPGVLPQILRRLGFEPVSIWAGGRSRKVWKIPKKLWTAAMQTMWENYLEEGGEEN
jgi:hypothetical protein